MHTKIDSSITPRIEERNQQSGSFKSAPAPSHPLSPDLASSS
jgi:hypothetical protein